MNVKKDTSGARERILEVASALFYQQGYRATGINEVIDRSGVAKATFYAHFPSKDDLCLAYLKRKDEEDITGIRQYLNQKRTPLTRFYGVMEAIELWLEENNFRGCSFLNIVPEVEDPANILRQQGKKHYNKLRDIIRELGGDLIASAPDKYGQHDAGKIADEYMVILAGAIALTEIYQDNWPVKEAIEKVKKLI